MENRSAGPEGRDPKALPGIPPAAAGEDLILIVAYDDKARAAIVSSPRPPGVVAVACSTFREAQDCALSRPCRGVLVDLTTMIKARDQEKIIAHTITGIYPTLRVKSLGPMLVPMIMSGDAQQDRSLSDFFSKTCSEFAPRRLRSHKRRNLCLPTRIGSERGFTVNISWSGAFIADMNPERFAAGQELTVTMLTAPDAGIALQVQVARIERWGERHPPGIGVRFKGMDQQREAALLEVLGCDKDLDHDRLPM